MTIKEYIDKDFPFYHITRSSNMGNFLKYGLRPKRCNAICTERSDVLEY